MRNKAAAAALGGEEAEQINSGAAESPMSAAIKAFKSDVTLGGGGMGVADGRWEGGGGRRRNIQVSCRISFWNDSRPSTITPTIKKKRGRGLSLSVVRLHDQQLIEEMKLHSRFVLLQPPLKAAATATAL